MKNSKLTVGIINLNFNNLYSIHNACIKSGFKTSVITAKQKNFNYDIVIIPGVGAFKSGMKVIKKNKYDEKIFNYLSKPNSFIYGICLGMQLLFEKSFEFGSTKGLGLIKGKILSFNEKNKSLKTHMGWCQTNFKKKTDGFNLKKFNKECFYYVHSYYANPTSNSDKLANASHEKFLFTSAVKKNNILGTQFHPEKSGKLGLEFLKNLKNYKD